MKVFQKVLMASEDVKSYLVSGVSASVAFNDGDAVVVGGLKSSEDFNVRSLTYGTGATAIVDYVGVSHGTIQGVTYREGIKTAGLSADMGEVVRCRVLAEGDTFYLASGNFTGTPAVGKFATAAADGTWTIKTDDSSTADTDESTEAPASGLYLKIEASKNLVMGVRNADTLYFCTAHIA